MELDFCVFKIKIAYKFKSQETEKFDFFSHTTYDSQNLRYETLVSVDYNCVKISRIAVVDIKLWMKEDLDLHTNHL